jgi:hypothetical protein
MQDAAYGTLLRARRQQLHITKTIQFGNVRFVLAAFLEAIRAKPPGQVLPRSPGRARGAPVESSPQYRLEQFPGGDIAQLTPYRHLGETLCVLIF